MAAVDKTQPAPMTVKATNGADGVVLVSIAGELDMSNVNAARRQLDHLLPIGPASIVFDLADLTFMDSSGIALLIQVAARVKEISLRHVPALIERVLEATGVSELLAVER